MLQNQGKQVELANIPETIFWWVFALAGYSAFSSATG